MKPLSFCKNAFEAPFGLDNLSGSLLPIAQTTLALTFAKMTFPTVRKIS